MKFLTGKNNVLLNRIEFPRLCLIIAFVDCDWLSDLIEGAPEVATVNPTAERLKQGAGKNI